MESSAEITASVLDDAPSTLEPDVPLVCAPVVKTTAVPPPPTSGSVKYGYYGTTRYDKFPVASRVSIKGHDTLIPAKPIGTAIYRKILDPRHLIGEQLRTPQMLLYEAWRVVSLTITFQEAANPIKVSNAFWCHYVQDPFRRSTVPAVVGNDGIAAVKGDMRYGDTIIVRQGDNVVWHVPITNNIFYTLDTKDLRFSKPGLIFIDSMRVLEYSQTVTFNFEVEFFCPTVCANVAKIDRAISDGITFAGNDGYVSFPSTNVAMLSGVIPLSSVPALKPGGTFYYLRPNPCTITYTREEELPTVINVILTKGELVVAGDGLSVQFIVPELLAANIPVSAESIEVTVELLDLAFIYEVVTTALTDVNKYLVR